MTVTMGYTYTCILVVKPTWNERTTGPRVWFQDAGVFRTFGIQTFLFRLKWDDAATTTPDELGTFLYNGMEFNMTAKN